MIVIARGKRYCLEFPKKDEKEKEGHGEEGQVDSAALCKEVILRLSCV